MHLVASASSSHPITAMRVYVDSNSAYTTNSGKIDTSLSLASGKHALVVDAWDSTGALQKATLTVTVSGTSTTTTTSTAPSTATTFSSIEQMSGWKACSSCANAGGGATFSMQQGITSPSLDGKSTRFNLGGTVPWSHALFYKRLSNNGTATNFVYDVYYYYQKPSASSGMEFSNSQAVGTKWYRWDWQCSYTVGLWRYWDGANSKWINTAVPCTRPTAYTWTHVQFQGKRANGQTQFVAISINGQTHYINRSVGPTPLASPDYAVTIHFQLNGDANQTDYSVWGDKFSLKYW